MLNHSKNIPQITIGATISPNIWKETIDTFISFNTKDNISAYKWFHVDTNSTQKYLKTEDEYRLKVFNDIFKNKILNKDWTTDL